MELQGRPVWVGRCIHCNSRLVLESDGKPVGSVTVEHLVPQHAGGTDDPLNLALACARCNHLKGVRQDRDFGRDPAVDAMVERLLRKRRARWRDAEDA
ncbi:MAG: HNH endonuclease [Deltaproteobacteria bacterium]|nr:HNH endonuclease [Deltaproteobacteria bacterium]